MERIACAMCRKSAAHLLFPGWSSMCIDAVKFKTGFFRETSGYIRWSLILVNMHTTKYCGSLSTKSEEIDLKIILHI